MKRLGEVSKVVKNVRIVALSDVPPAFLLRPRVIAAVRREVLHDLRKGLKRVPAGVEAEYKERWYIRLLRAMTITHRGGKK